MGTSAVAVACLSSRKGKESASEFSDPADDGVHVGGGSWVDPVSNEDSACSDEKSLSEGSANCWGIPFG